MLVVPATHRWICQYFCLLRLCLDQHRSPEISLLNPEKIPDTTQRSLHGQAEYATRLWISATQKTNQPTLYRC
jgi:hypothetical protein